MKKKEIPVGVVVTLVILWLGLLGVTGWGWWTMHTTPESVPPGANARVSTSVPMTATAAPETPRLVWTQDALWRFGINAGGAALVAVLFLLLAVGAGVLVQEKAESASE